MDAQKVADASPTETRKIAPHISPTISPPLHPFAKKKSVQMSPDSDTSDSNWRIMGRGQPKRRLTIPAPKRMTIPESNHVSPW